MSRPRQVTLSAEQRAADKVAALERRIASLEVGAVHSMQRSHVLDPTPRFLGTATSLLICSQTVEIPQNANLVLAYAEMQIAADAPATGEFVVLLDEPTDLGFSGNTVMISGPESVLPLTLTTYFASVPAKGGDALNSIWTTSGKGGPRAFKATPGTRTYSLRPYRGAGAGTIAIQNASLWIWVL